MTIDRAGGAASNQFLSSGQDGWASADPLGRIARALAIVECCLCETFPADFHRRCAFAAYGVRELLRDDGLDPDMVGGQFAAFVIAPDGGRMAVQGFKGGPEPYPHIWVEAAGRLIDLGPYLLPFGSDYPVEPMPALAWDLSAPLPAAFRYKSRQRIAANGRISQDAEIRAQGDAFVERCRAVAGGEGDEPVLPTWIASNQGSLLAAIDRNDAWAQGAKRFEQLAQHHPLPF